MWSRRAIQNSQSVEVLYANLSSTRYTCRENRKIRWRRRRLANRIKTCS